MAFLARKSFINNSLGSKLGSLGISGQLNSLSSNTQHFDQYFSPQFLTNPCVNWNNLATLFVSRRFLSTTVKNQLDTDYHIHNNETLDFPGGKVAITSEMRFNSEVNGPRVQCYRVLDTDGQICGESVEVSKELALKMYRNMVTLQIMDTMFYEAQRQGRISFYATTTGEEAINIASAAALSLDDLIVPQFREPGALLWRGFTLQEFTNQLFSNRADNGKGRQMPVHYGSNKLNYFTVASTVATQLPHAVGAAYSLKMDNRDLCAVAYIGDGGTSTGDFHAALNFSAVLETPVTFFCRNNGWAISTPVSEQMKCDGVVVKGQGYGIRSIRIDGNDALAVYNAVLEARKLAIREKQPILIEELTYRTGHHSTSDDSTRYRPAEEIEWWRKTQDPVQRFRKWIGKKGWWNDEKESQMRSHVREQLLQAIQVAEKLDKPPVADLFSDVYDVLPPNLQEQERFLMETMNKHPEDYPSNIHA